MPDLTFAEVGQSLLGYVRAGAITHEQAIDRLRYVLELPLVVESLSILAVTALGLAVLRGTGAYEAYYLALADAVGAVLVTADRRLAAEASRSALLPGSGPPA